MLRVKTSLARFRHASIVRVSGGRDFQLSMSISRTSASTPLGPITVISSEGDLLVRRKASQLMAQVYPSGVDAHTLKNVLVERACGGLDSCGSLEGRMRCFRRRSHRGSIHALLVLVVGVL